MKTMKRLVIAAMLSLIGSSVFAMSFPPGSGLRGWEDISGPTADVVPVLKISWRNDAGKLFSYNFVDRQGQGSLPSQATIDRLNAHDGTNWTILGAFSTNPNPPPVPLPAAAYLFGSALFGLLLVGRRRMAARKRAE